MPNCSRRVFLPIPTITQSLLLQSFLSRSDIVLRQATSESSQISTNVASMGYSILEIFE